MRHAYDLITGLRTQCSAFVHDMHLRSGASRIRNVNVDQCRHYVSDPVNVLHMTACRIKCRVHPESRQIVLYRREHHARLIMRGYGVEKLRLETLRPDSLFVGSKQWEDVYITGCNNEGEFFVRAHRSIGRLALGLSCGCANYAHA